MPEIRYMKIEENDFTKLLQLFLNDNAVAYSIKGDICFGTRVDLDKVPMEPFDANFVLLTKDLSCNVMIENCIVKMMTIYRP